MFQIQVETEAKVPGSKFPVRITISIVQNWKQFLAIQTAGCRVTCVAFDIELSIDAIRHVQCKKVS